MPNRLKFNRPYDHDRGEKGGTVTYAGGQLYDVPDDVAAIVTEGDNPIAFDPDNPPEPEGKPSGEQSDPSPFEPADDEQPEGEE